jgi:hypothetical protein
VIAIPRPILPRHRDQGGAVVNQAAGAEIVIRQIEKIALQQADIIGFVNAETIRVEALALVIDLVVLEKGLDGKLRQFDTNHFVALGGNPRDIKGLAAKRQKYAGAVRQAKAWKVFLQMLVYRGLVKSDAVFFPAIQPVLIVDHLGSWGRGKEFL